MGQMRVKRRREREKAEREKTRFLPPGTPDSGSVVGVSIDVTPDTRTLDLTHGNFTLLPDRLHKFS